MPLYGTATSLSGVPVSRLEAQRLLAMLPPYSPVGAPGSQAYGVSVPGTLPSGFSPMTGSTDVASANYGNYTYTDGSVMVFIPAFYYRIGHASNPTYVAYGANSVHTVGLSEYSDTDAAAADGFALHRAFYNAGAIQTALDLLGADAAHIAVYAHAVLRIKSEKVLFRRMPGDALATAQQLFAVLRGFDDQGARLIWIENPPASPEWDGVRDRLGRAAAS